MIQTPEQYQFLYSTLAEYSKLITQLDENQKQTTTENQHNLEEHATVQLKNLQLDQKQKWSGIWTKPRQDSLEETGSVEEHETRFRS